MELALAHWPREGHIEPSVVLDLEEFSEFEAKRPPSMLRIGVHRTQRQGPSGRPCTYLSPGRKPTLDEASRRKGLGELQSYKRLPLPLPMPALLPIVLSQFTSAGQSGAGRSELGLAQIKGLPAGSVRVWCLDATSRPPRPSPPHPFTGSLGPAHPLAPRHLPVSWGCLNKVS